MSYAMLSVETVIAAAEAALKVDLKPDDLDGLNSLTRLNLVAALAKVALEETPAVTTMAISPDDFALLSGEWKAARETGRPPASLPKPRLVEVPKGSADASPV